jgi:hypothetical protein
MKKSETKNIQSHSRNTGLSAGWISIKEKLPEFDLPVLVCKEGSEDTIEICRLESKIIRKDSVSLEWLQGKSSYDYWYHEVTHWQFLPACR